MLLEMRNRGTLWMVIDTNPTYSIALYCTLSREHNEQHNIKPLETDYNGENAASPRSLRSPPGMRHLPFGHHGCTWNEGRQVSSRAGARGHRKGACCRGGARRSFVRPLHKSRAIKKTSVPRKIFRVDLLLTGFHKRCVSNHAIARG